MALLFFTVFHVMGFSLPSFTPDFTDKTYGPYGRRPWYECVVFFPVKDMCKQMSYDGTCSVLLSLIPMLTMSEAHRNQLKQIHLANNVSISKVTHAGRVYAAQNARTNGASESGTKALGGWSENGSFRQCYERTWPIDAMLAAGGFNGSKPERYCLPRAELGECPSRSYPLSAHLFTQTLLMHSPRACGPRLRMNFLRSSSAPPRTRFSETLLSNTF